MSPEDTLILCTACWTFASVCWGLSIPIYVAAGKVQMAAVSTCVLLSHVTLASYYWVRLLA